MSWQQELSAALSQRQSQHLYRQRQTLQTAQGAKIVVDGQSLHNFCSNDYLGLANHPALIKAFTKAASQSGVGSGASHLVSGHHHQHHALEEELAEFTGRERALLFSSGYLANLAIVTSLLGKQDAVFEDKLNHASLLDGGLLSGARFRRFLHNDVESLVDLLEQSKARRRLIAVDAVFSMDGDMAPLRGLAKAATASGAILMADDAHGFGCLGKTGAGSCEAAGIDASAVPVLMATLGKAIGCAGAFVAGSDELIETLIQFGRSYIYTTALPPAVAAAARCGLELLQSEAWRRDKLQQLIKYFRHAAEQSGLPVMPSSTAIQPLLLGDSATTLRVAQQLREQGFLVGAIRPPTVPRGSARLRITLSAAHEEQQLNKLLEALQHSCKGAHN
ncbi:MAG: 8-amino-7-oxononanoate synthase [Pseudomonadales bacterium]